MFVFGYTEQLSGAFIFNNSIIRSNYNSNDIFYVLSHENRNTCEFIRSILRGSPVSYIGYS